MPRLSAEARAGAALRAGDHRRPPPKGLCAAARRIWCEIVAERPADWFDAGSAPLLRLYCTLSVYCERLEPLVAEGDPAAAKELRKTSGTLTTLATKLRLSVQAVVRRDAGKLNERGPGLLPLLGGNAVAFPIRGRGGRPEGEAS